MVIIPTLLQAQVANPIADQSYSAFNTAFIVQSVGQAYYKVSLKNNDKDYYWMQALDIETAQDAYFRTRSETNKTLISDLLNAFLINNSGNGSPKSWEWNEYNDDLAFRQRFNRVSPSMVGKPRSRTMAS